MKTRGAIILATLSLLCFVAFAFAVNWYYSTDVSITGVDAWSVTVNSLGSNPMAATGSIVSVNGTVYKNGSPAPDITVILFAGVSPTPTASVNSTTTDVNGNYNFHQIVNSGLQFFRAGIEQ